ncbi:hypothetical protein BY458DRAFT_534001 [Sporodiniella umbellata]|nr:hypothetical protein BY458DRAFT_534001 [Sporodiniella umbellata]
MDYATKCPETTNKDTFRHSVASTATTATSASTSTQRLSVASFEEDLFSYSLYDKELRQSQTTKDVKDAVEYGICSDWLYKYEPPHFAFAKAWKKRFCVLTDRTVYIFKSSKPSQPIREQFELTENTCVFVTEEFKKGYVIELRKAQSKWYIRCPSVDQMKLWLERMKKIVGCIKLGFHGSFTPHLLTHLTLADNYQVLSRNKHHSLPLPDPPLYKKSIVVPQRKSLAEIPDWETIIPPQLPPPRTKLPPLPE